MKSIAELMREARQAGGVTQQDLAERSKQAMRTIAKVEMGQQVKLSTLRKIWVGLNIKDENNWAQWVAAHLAKEANQYVSLVRIMPAGKGEKGEDYVARWVRDLHPEKRRAIQKCMESPALLSAIQHMVKMLDKAYNQAIADIPQNKRRSSL
jgi:transcriptional regulator with XRE-family HTH domain